ncbi:MAG: glycosyltransferase [Candidatus Sumerlaeia bacterium]|nr:glycosyltransferase [Candidatus Sumerlaeia bacterium]
MKWIIAASHPLDSLFKVSAYHLTVGLARHEANEVFYLCAPISLFHRAGPSRTTDFDLRQALWRTGPRQHSARLWEYCPRTWLPYLNRPFFRAEWVARRTLKWTQPSLRHVLQKAGFDRPDIVLVINLQYAALFDLVRPDPVNPSLDAASPPARPLCIYRNIDEIRGMVHVPPSMIAVERDTARRADAVITVSVVQEEKMRRLGARRVFRLPHGVDLSAFDGPLPPEPPEYAGLARPRIVFVGALTQWVDHRLVVEVARRLSDASFVFIGPADPPFPDCLALPNMHYLGPRAFEAVPVYLRHADAAIIPFAAGSPIVESAHPLKLLMYLAAGLPTVCTPWRELKAMELPVATASNADDFAAALRQAAGGGRNPRLIESVRQYEWPRIVSRLEAIVSELRTELSAKPRQPTP